jgi:hypothetical protein
MLVTTIGQHVALDLALEKIIGRLRSVQRSHSSKRIHLGWREVAHADCPDFPGAMELRHRGCGLLDQNCGIRPMHLIDIDHVGLKPTQRILDFLHNACAARVPERLAILPLKPGLGRDHRVLAAAICGEGLADDFL